MDIQRSLLIALALLAASVAGCAEETGPGDDVVDDTDGGAEDPTPNIETITVGTEAAYPPFEDIRDGEIVGFDIAVMREIGNRSGFDVEFQNSEFNAIIPSIQNDQFDAGISAFTITDERKEQVDFSVPYYDNRLMAAVPAGTEGVDEPADLQGLTVCTQQGTTSQTYLEEELNFSQDDMLLLPSAPACAEAVQAGDADALMIDAAFVRHVIESSEGALEQAFVIETDEQFGIAVKKGNDELLTAINEALVAMRTDGTLEELQNEWQV